MRRMLFSLDTLTATHSLPTFALPQAPEKWTSDEDCVITVPTTGEEIRVDGCASYTEGQLDRAGVPLRFRFEQPLSMVEPQLAAIVINEATVIGDSGVVLDRNGSVVLESLWPSSRERPFEAIKAIPEFATCAGDLVIEEDVFLLFRGGGFNNYWHFHVDMLPITTFVSEAGLIGRCKLAVPTLKAWHRAAFARLGIDPATLIEFDNRQARMRRCILFSTMFHPSVTLPNRFARQTFQRLHDSVAAVRDEQREKLGIEGPKFVYVARTDGTSRLLVNEQALVDSLRRIGFEILVPTDLTYDQQLESFAKASLVVGPHGAGLTNIFAADKRALLIEIFPFGILAAPHYFLLSKSCGQNYEMYISRIKSQVSPHNHWTLDLEPFLVRLLVLVQRYGLGTKDKLLRELQVGPIGASRPSGAIAIEFGKDAAPFQFTSFGFYEAEPWGRWLIEREGVVLFHFDLPRRFEMTLDVVYHGPSLSKGLVVEFGETRHPISDAMTPLVITIDNAQQARSLWIEAPGATSPAEHLNDPSQDDRAMSIGIRSIAIRPKYDVVSGRHL